MKLQSIGASFRADWELGIAGVTDVSAGVVRSLRAYAEADVSETLVTIADAGDLGPGRAAGVLQAWRAWHPTYVQAVIARLLPELCERWPTRKEQHTRKTVRQKQQRWLDDACRMAEAIGAEPQTVLALQRKLQLRPGRFDRLLSALKEIGAVREDRPGVRLFLVAPIHWIREKILPLVSYI